MLSAGTCYHSAERTKDPDALPWVEEKRKTVARRGGFEITPFVVALTQQSLSAEVMLGHNGVGLQPEHLPLERLKAGAILPRALWVTHLCYLNH
jgi:hypothetical protein